jgi:hypothetical protein
MTFIRAFMQAMSASLMLGIDEGAFAAPAG